MYTFVTLSLAAFVCMSVVAADEMPPLDPLTAHCMTTMDKEETAKCMKPLVDAGVDIATFSNLKGKACCLEWDVPACFMPNIKANCTYNEKEAFDTYADVLFKYLNKGQCKGFEERSPACKVSKRVRQQCN